MKTHQRKREKIVEDYLVKKIKELGGMSLKWPAVGRKGVPDRICITPQAGTIFVEVKADFGRPTKLQVYTIDQINAKGGVAMLAIGKRGVDEIIDFVKAFGEREKAQ